MNETFNFLQKVLVLYNVVNGDSVREINPICPTARTLIRDLVHAENLYPLGQGIGDIQFFCVVGMRISENAWLGLSQFVSYIEMFFRD